VGHKPRIKVMLQVGHKPRIKVMLQVGHKPRIKVMLQVGHKPSIEVMLQVGHKPRIKVMLQVGRYVYEIMQTFHVDASRRLLSLDVDFYLAAGVSRMFVSVIEHDGPIGESVKVHKR